MIRDPQSLILTALKSGPSYGLELVKLTGLSHGCVYQNLRLLEQGLQIEEDFFRKQTELRGKLGRPRTYYRLVKS